MATRRSWGRLRKFRSGRWGASYVGPDGRLYSAPRTFAAKIDAEAWLTDRRREIDRDAWNPDASTKPAPTRFRPYAQRWLATRMVRGRPLRPRTVDHYQKILDQHLLPAFGDTPITAITMDAVDRWFATTLTDKPAMRAHCYTLLHSILETARTRDRLITANPCAIRGGSTVRRKIKPKPATVQEITTIGANMPPEYQAMVLLAAWCAMRFGELVELRRGDIDLAEGVVRVRRAAVRVGGGWRIGEPKSEAGIRDIAIPPHIVPVVSQHLRRHVGRSSNALLFPARSGGHLQPSALYLHYYPARAAAGRDDLPFHGLRGSGAVLAAISGATLADLMSRLGHSTVNAAMVYQSAAQGRDKQIAELLSKLAEGDANTRITKM